MVLAYALNTGSTDDWKGRQWTAPINASVWPVLRIGGQLIGVVVRARHWAGPDTAPRGWALGTCSR